MKNPLDSMEPYPNVVAPINKSENQDDELSKAYQAYELQEYSLASSLLQKLPEQDAAAIFYRGLCELSIGNEEKSLGLFLQITNSVNTFYYPSRWYQALVLVKLDRVEEARPLLEKIAENAPLNTLREKASKLLKEI